MGVTELKQPINIHAQLDDVMKAAEVEFEGEMVISAILIVRTGDRIHTCHSPRETYELLGLLEMSKVSLIDALEDE